MAEIKTAATTSHVRMDIDKGVIITSAITNEAVAELNLIKEMKCGPSSWHPTS